MFVMILLCMRELMNFNIFIVKSKCYALLCFLVIHTSVRGKVLSR